MVHIVTNGRKEKHLQYSAVGIFKLCSLNGISTIPRWTPKCQYESADFISRIIDYNDRHASAELFQYLDQLWEPHTTDRFADFRNRKTSRYNPRFWNPGCEVVDAFSQNWSGENNWLVPPVYFIESTIRHLLASKAYGALIAPFWSLLYKSLTEFQPYVSEDKNT